MDRTSWIGTAAMVLAAPVSAQPLGDEVQRQMPSLMAIYEDLHANPELSFMEVRSAGILAGSAIRQAMRSPMSTASMCW